MKLLTKVTLLVAISLSLFAATISCWSGHLIDTNNLKIQEQRNRDMLVRTEAAIGQIKKGLSKSVQDYAYWTDTYNYVLSGEGNYAEVNLNEDNLTNLELDGFLVFRTDGTLVNGDLSAQSIQDWNPSVQIVSREFSGLAKQAAAGKVLSDIMVNSAGGLVLYSAAPILKDDHSGPPVGTVLHFREMGASMLEEISSLVLAPVSIRSLAQAELFVVSPDFPNLKEENTLKVEETLADANGHGIARLSLLLNRDIETISRDMRYSFYLSFLVMILGAGLILAWLLKTLFLKRLETLAWSVRNLIASKDLTHRVPEDGDDELGGLSKDFNQLLKTLDDAQKSENAIRREKEALSQKLIQVQKMEALGTLAGGMAHDFNNMLYSILCAVEVLKMESKEHPQCTKYLEVIKEAAMHGSSVVRQLGAFGRQSEPICKPYHLSMVISDALRMVRPAIPRNINLHFESGVTDDRVIIDENQIKQVLINLVTNSFQAIRPKNGTIRVRVSNVTLPDEHYPLADTLSPGTYLRLTVSDDGPGIPKEYMDRIFDPFFTTKGVGEGSGLGLAMVSGIIATHDGSIEARSELGQGATFVIHLPQVVDQEKPDEALPRSNTSLHGRRILMVEDDIFAREAMCLSLQQLGCVVTPAVDGEDGWAKFSANSDAFDLVMTDQRMPRLTGTQMSLRIRQKSSEVPIILISGYMGDLSAEELSQCAFKAVLSKPLMPLRLADILRESMQPA